MAQQKVDLFGQFRSTGVDNSGVQRARALAGLAGQVKDLAVGIGTKIRQKEGRQAGAESVQRDEDGKIVSPELESDFTVFGQNFNKAAVVAHRAQIAIDTKENLDRIQNENKLDPEAFKEKASAFKKGVLNGMPPELANIAAADIDSSLSQRFSNLNKEMFKRETQNQKAVAVKRMETGIDDILNATRRGDSAEVDRLTIDNALMLDQFVDTGLIDPVKAEQIKESTIERAAEQRVLQQMDSVIFNEDFSIDEKIEKGVDFLEDLRTKELKDLSPEQKDSLIRVVESKIGSFVSQRNSISNGRDIAREKVVSDLKVEANLIEQKAKNGEAVDYSNLVERIETLHNDGSIKGNERTSLLTHVSKAKSEADRVTLADKRIIARMQGDASIDMNPADIDSFYRRNIQDSIESLPPEVQSTAQANFIQSTRTVPQAVRGQIENNILSGDVELIAQSAGLIDRIDEIPGLSELAVTANQRAFIDQVVSLSQSLSPAEAVKIASELTDPRDSARVAAKTEEIKTEKYADKYESIVENEFETFFGADLLSDNINKQVVESEYKDLFESFFKQGMNKQRAQSKALETLRTNWRESDFGFMKYRPEDYYKVGSDTTYIKEQLTKDITTGFAGFSFNKKNIHLLSDDETARGAASGSPTYRVVVVDNNGELQALKGRWSPDVEAEVERQKEINKEIADGRLTEEQVQSQLLNQINAAPGLE